MAMTKAERAEMGKLREELAFRWPTEPEPVRTLRATTGYVEGWDYNVYARSVTATWSHSSCHGPLSDEGHRLGGTQGARSLYATRTEAMVALRWALCRDFAAILHIHDQRAEKGE